MDLKKAGCQKTGSLLFKKRRGQAASTLYNRSHLVLFLPRQKMEAILFLFLPKHFCCLFKKIPIIDCSNQLLISSMYIRHLAANSHQIQTLDALEPNWYLNLRFDVLNYYDRVGRFAYKISTDPLHKLITFWGLAHFQGVFWDPWVTQKCFQKISDIEHTT